MTADPTPDPAWNIRRIGSSRRVVTRDGKFHSSHASLDDARLVAYGLRAEVIA